MKFTDGESVAEVETLSNSYADNQFTVALKNRGQVALLVDYTNGGETSLKLQIELSPDPYNTTPSPDYYPLSQEDANAVVSPIEYEVEDTAKVRIPVPLLHQERSMRISFKSGGGSVSTATAVSCRVIDDSHSISGSQSNS